MSSIKVAIVSYLIGCFSSAYIVGKIFKSIDIREHGSGNSGATNALRVMGTHLGALTFLLDVMKGIVAVLIGKWIMGYDGGLIGGLFAVIGHNWPVFMRFKGGKGVAASLGASLILNWIATIISGALAIIIIIFTKYVSLGSITLLLSIPLVHIIITQTFNNNFTIFSVLLAIFAIIRHKDNFVRLKNGTENKIGR